jgi:predicted Zn-dependent peptidase
MIPAKPPSIKQLKPANIPDPVLITLKNKIPVYMIEAGAEDISRVEFIFKAGSIHETIPLQASVTNQMLAEGSENFPRARLNSELDYHGVFYNLYCERDRAGLVIFFMNKYIDRILELAKEILFYPVFRTGELTTILKKRHRSFIINRNKVNVLANDQFFESIFGNRHPYGRQTREEDFASLNASCLSSFHSMFYTHSNMAIIVAGKLHGKLPDKLNTWFGDINTGKPSVTGAPSSLQTSKDRRVHIEKKGALQTAIKIGSPSINKKHNDYPALRILNVILGGYFGSRLMRNIREDKGFTYGISSVVSSLDFSGFKVISTEVGNKYTGRTIEEIYREINTLQNVPVGKEELGRVRNYMLGDMVRMFDGAFAIAESFRSVWEFELDNTYFTRLAGKIKTIDPDEITGIARTYYNIDDLHEITVGIR